MTDRLANYAHGATCAVFAALAALAWVFIAALFFAGFCIVFGLGLIGRYAMPAAVVASMAGSVWLLLAVASQVHP